MKASEFISEVIEPKYVPWTKLLDYRESVGVHQVLAPDQDVPKDDAEHTLMFKLDEAPGGTAQAIINEVVVPGYREYVKVLLSAARKGTMSALKPDQPVPDDSEMGREFDIFIRLEA